MIERLLVRMARWAHRPPSWKMVKMVLAIIAVLLTIAAIERWVGWPDWMKAERIRPGKLGRMIEEKAARDPANVSRQAAPE